MSFRDVVLRLQRFTKDCFANPPHLIPVFSRSLGPIAGSQAEQWEEELRRPRLRSAMLRTSRQSCCDVEVDIGVLIPCYPYLAYRQTCS